MQKKILLLNGSPRPNGNTAALADAFSAGAAESGHIVTRRDLQSMRLHPCLGCLGGDKDPDSPCVQKDDMEQIYPFYKEADILVFASPMYYWSFSAQLKIALDRLFAVTEIDPAYHTPHKACVLLMAAEGDDADNFAPVLRYYESLLQHLGWEDKGAVLAGGVMRVGDIQGKPALQEAYALGKALR